MNIKKWLEERDIFWHKRYEENNGYRFWFYFKNTTFKVERYLFSRSNNFGLTMNFNTYNEGAITFFFGFYWLLSLYVSLENYKFTRFLPGQMVDSSISEGQFRMPLRCETGVRVHHGCIWFSLWNTENEWLSRQQWWRKFSVNYVDVLFGKSRQTVEVLSEGETVLLLDEGGYDIKYTERLVKNKRPRWFGEKIIRYDLDMHENPIPIPGKGENSWDIDDTAVYEFSGPASTLAEVVSRLENSVRRDRLRYGGSGWQPQ